ILFSITSAVITVGHFITALHDSTSVRWGTQTIFVRGWANSTMILQWDPPRPILRQFHNWNNRQNWPATQQWVCDTCKIDFEQDCNGKCGNMRWECSVCFPAYQLSPDPKPLNEYY